MDLKPCPCENCDTRKGLARVFDFHVYGMDCPYVCDEYIAWEEAIEAQDNCVKEADNGN